MSLIDFMQNDDWVYYKMVSNFLRGDFTLDPISAPTFYTQGILGFLFAKIFGISNLPNSTMLVSVAACFVLWLILVKFFNLSKLKGLFITLFLGFNPLFVYSILGFMTENYFVLCLLINFYLFYKFEKSHNHNDFIFLIISLFISFMLRQVALVFPITMAIYYFLNKRFKLSLLSILTFAAFYGFYLFVFPKTPEMYEKPLQFHHLTENNYVYALTYGSLLYVSAVLMPLLIGLIATRLQIKINLKTLLFILTAFILYFALNKYFDPHAVSWGEFPYFENTWERMGFYPRGVLGTKYQFRANYDLYFYWDLAAKTVLATFLSYLIFYFEKKKLLDFNLIFAGVYLGVMLLTETFYDRYLLVLFVVMIFFFAKNIELNLRFLVPATAFLAFLLFYCYQFSMDFILVNKFIWSKSGELVQKKSVNPVQIQGTNAWKLVNRNTDRYYKYDFSYDSPEINEVYRNGYELVATKKIEYPLNIFINSKIYLYKRTP